MITFLFCIFIAEETENPRLSLKKSANATKYSPQCSLKQHISNLKSSILQLKTSDHDASFQNELQNINNKMYLKTVNLTIPREIEIKDSMFDSCTNSINDGGAFYCDQNNRKLMMKYSCFNKCTSIMGNGGAIYFAFAIYVEIESSSFISCFAKKSGQSIYIEYGQREGRFYFFKSSTAYTCNINGNSNEEFRLRSDGTKFEEFNTTYNHLKGSTAVMYCKISNVELKFGNIIGNSAYQGNNLIFISAIVSCTNLNIINNTYRYNSMFNVDTFYLSTYDCFIINNTIHNFMVAKTDKLWAERVISDFDISNWNAYHMKSCEIYNGSQIMRQYSIPRIRTPYGLTPNPIHFSCFNISQLQVSNTTNATNMIFVVIVIMLILFAFIVISLIFFVFIVRSSTKGSAKIILTNKELSLLQRISIIFCNRNLEIEELAPIGK